MADEAAGAGPKRGFNFQDLAACYFFATDKPDFLDQRPLELHIEEFDSDFAFIIRFDDYNAEHFFEVKYRKSGDYKLSEFYATLEKFSGITIDYADSDNSSFYHFVTNASFGVKLKTFFEDAQDLRRRTKNWPQIRDKVVYESRNVNQLIDNTKLDEPALATMISGVFGHRHTEKELLEGIENFIRDCNSPGRFREPTKLLLKHINDKDTGIIRREELEQEAGISLTRTSDSTSSSTEKQTSELLEEMDDMADKYSDPSIDTRQLEKFRDTTVEVTDRLLDQDDLRSESIERRGTNIQENIQRVIDHRREDEQLLFGASKQTKRLIEHLQSDSTDNEGEKEDEI